VIRMNETVLHEYAWIRLFKTFLLLWSDHCILQPVWVKHCMTYCLPKGDAPTWKAFLSLWTTIVHELRHVASDALTCANLLYGYKVWGHVSAYSTCQTDKAWGRVSAYSTRQTDKVWGRVSAYSTRQTDNRRALTQSPTMSLIFFVPSVKDLPVNFLYQSPFIYLWRRQTNLRPNLSARRQTSQTLWANFLYQSPFIYLWRRQTNLRLNLSARRQTSQTLWANKFLMSSVEGKPTIVCVNKVLILIKTTREEGKPTYWLCEPSFDLDQNCLWGSQAN
jgi:hypothetical protein